MQVGHELSESVQLVPKEAQDTRWYISEGVFLGFLVDAENPSPAVGQCENAEEFPDSIRLR